MIVAASALHYARIPSLTSLHAGYITEVEQFIRTVIITIFEWGSCAAVQSGGFTAGVRVRATGASSASGLK